MTRRCGLCVAVVSLLAAFVQGDDVPVSPERSSVWRTTSPAVDLVLPAERSAKTVGTENVDALIHSLKERLDVLESRQKTLEAQPSAVLQANDKGFALKSADGNFFLKIKGDIHVDGQFYLNDGEHQIKDQFFLRRVRPALDVLVYGQFHGWIQLNLAPSVPTPLDDVYFEWLMSPLLNLRFGRFKPGVGLENLQSSNVLSFIERSLVSNLVPLYDTGAGVHGVFGDGLFNYALAYGNGPVDGGTGDSEMTDRKDVNGRLFVLPFKNGSRDFLKDLGFGLGASHGGGAGTAPATSPGLTAGYKSQGFNPPSFFFYNGNVVAIDNRTRWSPQFYWYPGPVSVMVEYVASAQSVKTTAEDKANLTHRAWQIAAGWVLTGDKTSFDGVKIKQNVDPKAGAWGAWEVVGRYSQLTVDNDAFSSFATPFLSARMARGWTGGINWYLNPAFKFQTNYAYTRFDGGAGSLAQVQDRKLERSLFTRAVFSF